MQDLIHIQSVIAACLKCQVTLLHPLMVSLFVSLFAVTGFVSFDAGFNPHTKCHCSLLEMSSNLELAVCL
jgi:hypothetical protein